MLPFFHNKTIVAKVQYAVVSLSKCALVDRVYQGYYFYKVCHKITLYANDVLQSCFS